LKKLLRVLMVEDDENDCLLLLRQLSNGGYEVKYERVTTAAAMSPLLIEGRWDVILSDWAMPGFGAVPALELLQKSGLDLPLIIVSGTVDEETTVGALKAGAHDFLLKSQLARLVPAIDREVRASGLRRDKHHSERLLRESELDKASGGRVPSSLVALEAVAPEPVAALRRAKLLVVDDEPMLLNVLRKALSREYEVSIIESPQAALDQVKAGARYDLILCDLMMPAMTGMELHARILELLPRQAERMVFLTGGAFTPDANAFLDRVSNLRISKPFNLVALKGLIAKRLAELPAF